LRGVFGRELLYPYNTQDSHDRTKQNPAAEAGTISPSESHDAFSWYGIALECLREGDIPAAETHFKALLEANPDYVPGYQMYAQTLAQHNRAEEAKTLLHTGIAAASRQGNQHARSEMEGCWLSLSSWIDFSRHQQAVDERPEANPARMARKEFR